MSRIRGPSGALLALIALLPFAVTAAPPGPEPVACLDPRGCPDLVVDEVVLQRWEQNDRYFPPESCAVKEHMIHAGNRTILRFAFTTPNIGAGDLVIGAPPDHPEWFEYAPCHDHYHFAEYADYRLWTREGYKEWDAARDAHPELTAEQVLRKYGHLRHAMVAGDKFGFCVIDITRAPIHPDGVVVPPDDAKYRNCDTNQGLSRGWADSYSKTLDGQWIDVTRVDPGFYVLEAEVNAERLFVESDYANNRGAVLAHVGVSTPAVEPPFNGVG